MNGAVWHLVVPLLLDAGFAVAAVDLPGHGRSQGPLRHTIEAMADWVGSVIDALDIENPALVGHSMGSLVALHIAARDERVARLALLGTGDAMKVHPELMAAAASGDADAWDMVAKWSAGRGEAGGGVVPSSESEVRAFLAAEDPAVLATDLRAVHDTTAAEVWARSVSAPTLVVIGAQDRMVPPAAARRLAEAFEDATVAEVDTGHMMMTDAPAAVARLVGALLTQ